MKKLWDTIAAPATSPVGSTIGIVRISGSKTLEILHKILDKKVKNPKKVYIRKIVDKENNKTVDEGIVFFFKKPFSYTGENMAEIQCHGGYITVEKIYSLVLKNGARAAERGEFTKRAFLNGKVDLTQAESVNSFIKAQNSLIAQNSSKMMNGIFSKRIKKLREILIEIIASCEAWIDFPEDDVDEISSKYLTNKLNTIFKQLNLMIQSYSIYEKLTAGIKIVIVGRPNTGKSSLLNAVLKKEKAIVTEFEGTTRDIVDEKIEINGLPVTVIDTAGIRNSENIIENEGIYRTKDNLKKADIVIFMLDSSEKFTEDDKKIASLIENKEKIIVYNKIDKGICVKEDILEGAEKVLLSLKTGKNFEEFEKIFKNKLKVNNFYDNEKYDFFIDNVRYLEALQKVKLILEKVYNNTDIPLTFTVEDLKEACDELGLIIGEVYNEDILDVVFSNFCIGK
ncbi:MAG: tRNA uridine-5-carboxymethylaminomethyl(34) synthesis GTPase MnmE [Candidatus Muiribacteriota bacterium]